jgi:predicted phage baseplate assembly protein
LLSSSRISQAFVMEMEDGVGVLRFGDDVLGQEPAGGTRFQPLYRVGNGRAGNVGSGALAHVVTNDDGIEAVCNILPAQGGNDAERTEDVRLDAPQAFRAQERAVTAADYAAAAESHPEVQKAVASRRWTGSWHTMFVTVDRRGGRSVDAAFEAELRAFLERFRLAGHDLEIEPPRLVPLHIAVKVCVAQGHYRAAVKAALREVFSNRHLGDGRRGFFHPDRFTFGQPVYLSQIISTAMEVPGVAWVDVLTFQRWGKPSLGERRAGVISTGRLEIAVLDNNPNAPEKGKITFMMEGGL